MKIIKLSLCTAAIATLMTTVNPLARADTQPLVGEIMMFAGPYCPKGWVEANGQLLDIQQNQLLVGAIAFNFGGDAQTTVGLPDLRGRVPMGDGEGPGLTYRPFAAKAGQEKTTLSIAGTKIKYQEGADGTAKKAKIVAGISKKLSNMPPVQIFRFCVAVQGTFPSRD